MSTPKGRLHGIGLGPGDPDLLTVKAVRLLEQAGVVSYFAKEGRCGVARTIAERWLPKQRLDVPLFYPVTTEIRFDHPDYAERARRLLCGGGRPSGRASGGRPRRGAAVRG